MKEATFIENVLSFGELGLLALVLVGLFILGVRFIPRILETWTKQTQVQDKLADAHREIATEMRGVIHAFESKCEDSQRRHSEVMAAFTKQSEALTRIIALTERNHVHANTD